MKLIISLFFLLVMFSLQAQEIRPVAYWDFESPEWEAGKTGKARWQADPGMTIGSREPVAGKYLSLGADKSRQMSAMVDFDQAISIEFLFRLRKGEMNPSWRFFWTQDNGLFLFMNASEIWFNTWVKTASGEVFNDNLKIPLNGSGPFSLGYYTDGKWHHMVFKYHAGSGAKEVWVDGEMPEGFSTFVAQRGTICRSVQCYKQIFFSDRGDDARQYFVGDLDEVAIYNQFIPSTLHRKHYDECRSGKSYSFQNDRNVAIPRPQEKKLAVDIREYAPGHPEVKISPIDQLRSFVAPRFSPGHGLRRNFNWMGMTYFAEGNFPGISQAQSCANSVAIQEELAMHWNYMIVLQNTLGASRESNLTNPVAYEAAWIKLANEHPEIPFSITTLWPQVRMIDIGEKEPDAFVRRKNLPPPYLLRDEKGNALDRAGKPTQKETQISPAAPDELFARDGQVQRLYLERILKHLTRPVDFINENGEVPPLPYDNAILEKIPSVVAHKKTSGITDWDQYQSRQVTRFRKAYSSQFLSLPPLKNTTFSWYGVDAGPYNLDRFEWTEARKVATPINGQYYSTPDFYPRWPRNWEKWAGPWRGWDWIRICREREIAAGDRLFSPFVAAGWGKDPEENIRPSQWLGLLKNLGVVGAEFFYTGFFNESQWPNLAHPRNYAWQAVMPVYAQAVTSRYEDVLRNGNVLKNTEGVPIIRHWAGDPRILVTVRKHDTKPLYIIAGNINPNSNFKGNVEDKKTAVIELDGQKLQFEVRRQGSVYVYDKTVAGTPVFYQLDTWHEAGHPALWSKNFLFEAEVFDKTKSGEVRTETASSIDGDYASFTSYWTPTSGKGCAEYVFEPRTTEQQSLYLRLRLRSADGKPTGVRVFLDGKPAGEFTCVNSRQWEWTEACGGKKVIFNNLAPGPHTLELRAVNTALQLDQLELRASASSSE
ncbi:MAG: LamG-like jellyroll fold domain-containing protein [Bacteroidia bacterium]|nr:LamG-like jellyroll fold domain-containing protein [Bacteroidia bacterium]